METGDESKTAKPMLEEVRNYSAAALIVVLILLAAAIIGAIFSIIYLHPRTPNNCDDGDPTTTDVSVGADRCINYYKGLDADCEDECLVDGAGYVALDPVTGYPVCNGTSLGQCQLEILMAGQVGSTCPWLHYKAIVADYLENFTMCGFGRCVYGVYVENVSFIDDIAEYINEDTMGDKVNQLCLDFIEDSEPHKDCLQATFFPLDITDSELICAFSFKNAHLDFQMIEDLFYPPTTTPIISVGKGKGHHKAPVNHKPVAPSPQSHSQNGKLVPPNIHPPKKVNGPTHDKILAALKQHPVAPKKI